MLLKTLLPISFLFLLLPNSFSQTQLGNDIDGEAATDNSGASISLSADGNTLAIGAPHNSGMGYSAGHTRIYGWSGGEWTQIGEDIDAEAETDKAGSAVSISADGKRVAIGAPSNDGNGTGNWTGHVRIFAWENNTWQQLGEDIDGSLVDDGSGHSVALSGDGNIVAVGAPYSNALGVGMRTGQVRVFKWMANQWVPMGADLYGTTKTSNFGHSVSLSFDGSRLAVGANRNDENGMEAGKVNVFDWDGAAWVPAGAAFLGEGENYFLGESVSLSSSGQRLAIGISTTIEHSVENASGKVKIFEYSDGYWSQLGSDIFSLENERFFGGSVALSANGKRVIVGARFSDIEGNDSGQARIFDWEDENWVQYGESISGETRGDQSGNAVAIAANGQTIAVGAFLNDGNGYDSGHVRVMALGEVSPLSIVTRKGIQIYPNPTLDLVLIHADEYDYLVVKDYLGRNIIQQTSTVNQVDLSAFPAGLYFFEFFSGNNRQVKKMIKQ